jgi:hypothetical protein
MKVPNRKSVKFYAVMESTIEAPCDPTELATFLKNSKFGGNVTIRYVGGGLASVKVIEQFPLTEAKLDKILEKA